MKKCMNLFNLFIWTALRNVSCIYLVIDRTIRNSNYKMHFMCLYDIRLYCQHTRSYTDAMVLYTHRTKKGNELHASIFVFTLFLFLFRFILFAQRSPYQPTTLNKTCNTRTATIVRLFACVMVPTYIHDDDVNIYMCTSHAPHIAFVRCTVNIGWHKF